MALFGTQRFYLISSNFSQTSEYLIKQTPFCLLWYQGPSIKKVWAESNLELWPRFSDYLWFLRAFTLTCKNMENIKKSGMFCSKFLTTGGVNFSQFLQCPLTSPGLPRSGKVICFGKYFKTVFFYHLFLCLFKMPKASFCMVNSILQQQQQQQQQQQLICTKNLTSTLAVFQFEFVIFDLVII